MAIRMAYEVVMPYHLHMPSYFLETFTEYPQKAMEFLKKLLFFLKNVLIFLEVPDFTLVCITP